jgi:hypothetical protein
MGRRQTVRTGAFSSLKELADQAVDLAARLGWRLNRDLDVDNESGCWERAASIRRTANDGGGPT